MPKDLARGIAAAAVVAVLAVGSASSWAQAPKRFSAELEERGAVEFSLNEARSRVKEIRLDGVQVACGDNTAQIDFMVDGTTPVRDDRSFAVRSVDKKPRGIGEALVKGVFSRRFKRAEGIARIRGDFKIQDQWYRDCESGKQGFVAR